MRGPGSQLRKRQPVDLLFAASWRKRRMMGWGFCKSLFREGRDFLESEDLRKEDKVRRHGLDRLFEHCTNVKIKIRVESVRPQGEKLQNIETVREPLF